MKCKICNSFYIEEDIDTEQKYKGLCKRCKDDIAKLQQSSPKGKETTDGKRD